jgi:hypothetical protein
MGFKIYDASEISVSIAGIPIDPGTGPGGYADGEFMTIEWEGDQFTDVVGTDGEVTRSKTNDLRATATLRLMQSSAANAALSALSLLDQKTPNGAGVGAFMVRDRSGLSIHEAAECWIAQMPNATYGREAGPREWKIRIAKLNSLIGGN